MVQTMKGQCLFDKNRYCENRDCLNCPICLDAIERADKEMRLCPVCGVDWATVLGMLRDKGNEDNQDTALSILYNCSECRRHFGGER